MSDNSRINTAEERASIFYNTVGWESNNDISEDAKRWEDLRDCAEHYVSKCRMRVYEQIPKYGEYLLDMASGPIQYEEYLRYSENFSKRYCVDLSKKALAEAKSKIGDHGEYLLGSFFDIPLEDNFFDCSISLHTIFHIDKDLQEEAVRKLIAVTKPGKPVIIVYGNPNTYTQKFRSLTPKKLIKKLKKRFKNKNSTKNPKNTSEVTLYFHLHPLEWWLRFETLAEVEILPWRSFDSETQKQLFPNNRIGKFLFSNLFKLESRFPEFFVKHFQYPMIILTKK